MMRTESIGGLPPDAVKAKPKETSEVSVSEFVHTAVEHEWKKLNLQKLNYQDVSEMLESVRDVSFDKFVSAKGTLAEKAEQQKRVTEIVLDEVLHLVPAVTAQRLQIFDVLADVFPENDTDVFLFTLAHTEATPQNRETRVRMARKIYDRDASAFAHLFEFVLAPVEGLDLAQTLSTREQIDLFSWFQKSGVVVNEALAKRVVGRYPSLVNAYAKFAHVSSDHLFEFIQTFDPYLQDEIHLALSIPARSIEEQDEDDLPAKGRLGFKRKIESEIGIEQKLDVEHMRALGDLLAEAMKIAYPEQAEYIQASKEQEAQLFGSIEKYGELALESNNSPLFVFFKDSPKLLAVYKPQKREAFNNRDHIPRGTYAPREWLAYQIDQALQIHTTPVTILRNGTLGVGSVQEWKIGKTENSVAPNKPNADQLEDLVFDDVIKQNTDRHSANYLVSFDGSVHGIDHGLILPEAGPYWVRSHPGIQFRGKQPSKRVQDRIEQFRVSKEVETALRNCFDAALGSGAEYAWETFKTGMEFLSPQNAEHTAHFPFAIQTEAKPPVDRPPVYHEFASES